MTFLCRILPWVLGFAAVAAQERAPLTLVRTIPLPGVEGRFDHFAVDLERQRLFVAALGNDTLEVLDLAAGKVLRQVRGMHEPQGVAYAPDLDRLFVGNGRSGTCEILDGTSLAPIRSVRGLDDADNVRYDARARRVYVGYGRGALAVLDARSGRLLGQIPLKGHPESFQLEKSGPRIFVNVPQAGHVAVVDRNERGVVATWPVTGASANFPMALDEANRRLFVGCRRPARLLVFDTTSGKQVASAEIAGDTDDLWYDTARKRVYAVCGEGAISVLRQKDPDCYEPLSRVPTAPGARTGFFAPDLDRLYVAVPHRGSQRAEIRVFAPQH